MFQHLGSRKDHSSWVGDVLTGDVQTNVSATWFENGVVSTVGGTWDQTWTTDQSSTDVGQDGTVHVWSDHNVELLRLGDSLHGSVINNQVLDFNVWVFCVTDFLDGVSEQTVTQLHDVSLVDGSDEFSVVLLCVVESKSGDSFGLVLGDDLQGFDDTWDGLVFQTGVFCFGVFSHQNEINVVQLGRNAFNVLDEDEGSVDVKFLSEGNVKRLDERVSWGVGDTLQTNLVSLDGEDGFFDLGLVTFKSGHVDGFKLDRDVFVLEDLSHGVGDFLTDTITRNQGDGELSTVFLWERVGSHVSHCDRGAEDGFLV